MGTGKSTGTKQHPKMCSPASALFTTWLLITLTISAFLLGYSFDTLGPNTMALKFNHNTMYLVKEYVRPYVNRLRRVLKHQGHLYFIFHIFGLSPKEFVVYDGFCSS